MIFRSEIAIVTLLLLVEVECNDQYLASEFRVLTDVLESVIFGAIVKNASIHCADISIQKDIISNAESSKTNGVSTTNGKKIQKLNSRRPIKKRRQLKNISSSTKKIKASNK